MEELEQPTSVGSTELGKFKDAESLLMAYNNLEAEFTKKSQKLATLENEQLEKQNEELRRQDIEKRVDDFVIKFGAVRPFSESLKDNLTNNSDQSIEEAALSLLTDNYKTPAEYVNDDEFLNNYIYSNQTIKDKIIKDYLSRLTQDSPIKVEGGMHSISLVPPTRPTTIAEAGRLAQSIIKQK